MSEDDKKRLARGNAYRMAFWLIIRRLNIYDFKDALDMLMMCCSVEGIDTENVSKIVEETTENYLRK